MLTGIELVNFKGHNNTEIDLSRVTLLIGPNGTGKSSILQALLALKQSINGDSLILDGPIISIGSFQEVLTKGTKKNKLGIGITADIKNMAPFSSKGTGRIKYRADFGPKLIGTDTKIFQGTKKLLEAKMPGHNLGTVMPSNLIKKFASGQITVQFAGNRRILYPVIVNSLVNTPGMEQQGQEYYSSFNEFFSQFEELVKDIYYIPSIRGIEKPYYNLADSSSTDFKPGMNEELVSTFAYSGRAVEQLVSKWSEKVTGSSLSYDLVKNKRVEIRSNAAVGGISIIGDGFGVNQLFQLLLTLAITPKDSTICIEEPEIHLHPKAQTKLGMLLSQIVKEYDKQLLITTHSQYILFAFVNAVRGGSLGLKDLSIYSFPEKGIQPNKVEQDQHGDIYDWDKNFFYMPN